MSEVACSIDEALAAAVEHDLLAVGDPAPPDEPATARIGGDEVVADRRRFPEGERRAARLHEAEQGGDAR